MGQAANRFSNGAFITGTFPTGLLPALDAVMCERFGSAVTLQPFIESSTYSIGHLFDPMIREPHKKFQKTHELELTNLSVPLADRPSHKRTRFVGNDLRFR
jgi:hypothetical protein